MTLLIEPYDVHHHDAVVRLSLRAWAPVFDSIQQVLDRDVYQALHPDWRINQQQAVEAVCDAPETHVWVALDDGAVVGFVAVMLHPEAGIGEISMVAVDPDAQQQGVGTALMTFALDWITKAGMPVAMVETAGDPGHAPARRTYEKLGFELLPIARYFKKLEP